MLFIFFVYVGLPKIVHYLENTCLTLVETKLKWVDSFHFYEEKNTHCLKKIKLKQHQTNFTILLNLKEKQFQYMYALSQHWFSFKRWLYNLEDLVKTD